MLALAEVVCKTFQISRGLQGSTLNPSMNRLLLLALTASFTGLSAQESPPPQTAHGDQAPHANMAAMGNGRRLWSAPNGKVSGSIRAIRGSKVQLQLEDGKRLTLAIADLDAMDGAAVTGWQMTNRAPDGFGAPDVTITLETMQGQMKYDQSELTVAPGAKVRLVLHNVDDMHHNFILCTPGEGNAMEVAQAAWKLGGDGFAKQWIPEHPKVLHASPMVDPHATRHMYFVAPSDVGAHPYVCTLPGHAAFMKGELTVQEKPQVLSELTYTLYHGNFDSLPDFDTLTPIATDHVPSGLIDLSVAKRNERFALVFDGLLHAPKDGDYRFDMVSDDGSRLTINGKEVINADGVHSAERNRGKIKLTQGSHRISVSYFERSGEEVLYLFWNGPDFKNQPLSADQPKRRNNRAATGLPLAASNGETRIYRNFIEGAGNRAIGVGYPNGINLAFDADQMRLALVWLGGFIDAARHWNGRGQGHQPPLGYGVTQGPPGAPFARLESKETSWPEPEERSTEYHFKGYDLMGKVRFPRFRYRFGEIEISDQLKPYGDVLKNDAALMRCLHLKAANAPDYLYFRAALAKDIRVLDEERYLINSSVILQLSSNAATQALLRKQGDQWELLLPVVFDNGQAILHQHISYNLSNAE